MGSGSVNWSNGQLIASVQESDLWRDVSPSGYEPVLAALSRVDRGKFVPMFEELIFQVDASAVNAFYRLVDEADDSGRLDEQLGQALIDIATSARESIYPHWAYTYFDRPVQIGHSQTCSQPSLVAYMAYLLDLQPGMRVLEVGSGCGYSAAVAAELIGPQGRLYTMEIIPELARLAASNISRHFGCDVPLVGLGDREGLESIISGRQPVSVVLGDGSEGLQQAGLFDRIYLAAGVRLGSFNEGLLAGQLESGNGIMVFPEADGSLFRHVYRDGVQSSDVGLAQSVKFVPLRGNNS